MSLSGAMGIGGADTSLTFRFVVMSKLAQCCPYEHRGSNLRRGSGMTNETAETPVVRLPGAVTMLTSGAATRATATLIQPLLKPDLPVYLWWLGDPPEDETILRKLTDLSSRVIVDSNSFLAPEQSISSLSTFLQESPNCALSDL